jgi:ABC-type transport system substrate-binding protein
MQQNQVYFTINEPKSYILNVQASADAGTSNSDSEDLKGQITKFLEEMIEKHPDTLVCL